MNRDWVVLPLAALVLGWGCGPSTKDADATRTGTKKAGRAAVTFDDQDRPASPADGALAIPADFPKDVPLYPGAKVSSVAKGKKGPVIGLTTDDPVMRVQEFYADKLKANGWEVEPPLNTPLGRMLTAGKGSSECTVHIDAKGGRTTVTLHVEKLNP